MGVYTFHPMVRPWLVNGTLWDLTEDKPKVRGLVPIEDGSVDSLVYLANSKQVLVSTDKGKLHLCDLGGKDLQQGKSLSISEWDIRATAISQDGKTLAVASGNAIRLWQIAADKLVARQAVKGHTEAITCLSLGGEDTQLATAGRDGSLRLWRVKNGEFTEKLGMEEAFGYWDTIALTSDGTRLAAGCLNWRLKLWDVTLSEPVGILNDTKKRIQAMAFDRDGKLLATTGDLNSIQIRDVTQPDQAPVELTSAALHCRAIAFTPDGRTLIAGGEQGGERLEIWNRIGSDSIKRKDCDVGFFGHVNSIAVDRDGKSLVLGGGQKGNPAMSGEVRMYELLPDQVVETSVFNGNGRAVCAVALTPDSKTLACADESGQVIVWDVAKEKKLHDWKFPGLCVLLHLAATVRTF